MSVHIDGSTLSALLFSQFNSLGNQYGILLGERTELIEDRISDSQIHTEDVKAFTTISSFIPWHGPSHVYSRNGKINDEVLAQLLKPYATDQTLVGWYSFRHQSSMRLSMKEAMLHQSLSTCAQYRGVPQDFYFLLCASSVQSNNSTHTCNHKVLNHVNGSFSSVPLTVLNLGDTTRKEYRKHSNSTLSHSPGVKNTFLKHRKEFSHSDSQMNQVVKMECLAENMNKSLMTVHSKVKESEAVLGLLEHEVRLLRQRLAGLEQAEMLGNASQAHREREEEQEAAACLESKRQNQEEQAELSKLLMDLELPPMPDALLPATGTTQENGQSLQSFSLLEPVPSMQERENEGGRGASGSKTNISTVGTSTVSQQHDYSTSATCNSRDLTKPEKQITDVRKEEPFAFVAEAVRMEKELTAKKLSPQPKKQTTTLTKTSDLTFVNGDHPTGKPKAVGSEGCGLVNGTSSSDMEDEDVVDLMGEISSSQCSVVTSPPLETLPSSSPVF